MRFDDLDDLAKAGFIVALIGSMLAMVPQLERLIDGVGPAGGPATLLLLSLGVLVALAMTVRGWPALGGIIAGALGLVVAVVGPTSPGVLALLGGVLIWVGSGRQGTQAEPERVPQRSPEPR